MRRIRRPINFLMWLMKARQFFFLIAFSILILPAKAQSILGSINIKEEYEIQSIEKGDSVLLIINRTIGYYNNKQTIESDLYWITGSEIGQLSTIRRSTDGNLIGLDNYKNGNLLVYFSESSKKKGALKVYKSEASKFSTEPISIPIVGQVLSSYQDTCLNLVLLEKKTSTLKILQIREAAIIGEKTIKIPFKLDSYKDSEIGFIDPSGHIRMDQSFAKVKFFKNENTISLVLDEPMLAFEEAFNPPFKTSLFSYTLDTDKTDIKLFFEFTKGIFRSFLVDQFLFKVINSREGDHLIVFDITSQKQLIDQLILPKESKETTEGFYRNGRNFKIQKDLLKELPVIIGYSDQWSPVIMVEKQMNDYVISVGNFSNNKGVVTAFSSINPMVGLLVSVVGTAIKQSRENPAMSTYTYLIGSPTKGFSHKVDLDYYKKKIDEFEVSATKEFKFKGYISSKNWSAGLYMFEDSNQLSIVKFQR